MANDISRNPLVLDTIGLVVASTTEFTIEKIRWASPTANGSLCRLEHAVDSTGTNVFWQDAASASQSNPHESDFAHMAETARRMFGMRLATLTSGSLFIYVRP